MNNWCNNMIITITSIEFEPHARRIEATKIDELTTFFERDWGFTDLQFTFPDNAPPTDRAAFAQRLGTLIRTASGDDLSGHEGWNGPHVTFDDDVDHLFVVRDDNEGWFHLARWTAENILSISPLYGKPENAWVEIHHWHPDSMTSGSWIDALAPYEDDLFVRYMLNDDDGEYFHFSRRPDSAAKAADLVRRFVNSVELFGAEHYLLTMWYNGFDAPGAFENVVVDDCTPEGLGNEGYTISLFSLAAPGDVDAVLAERFGNPELNKDWLHFLDGRRPESWCTEDQAAAWSTLRTRLSPRAGY